MAIFILGIVKFDTLGLDSQVNLKLKVERDIAPTRLSEFSGGVAELYDGYSTATIKYEIVPLESDFRRIKLISECGNKVELAPTFFRKSATEDPLNQLQEIPLMRGQDLYEYKVMSSNWGLK